MQECPNAGRGTISSLPRRPAPAGRRGCQQPPTAQPDGPAPPPHPSSPAASWDSNSSRCQTPCETVRGRAFHLMAQGENIPPGAADPPSLAHPPGRPTSTSPPPTPPCPAMTAAGWEPDPTIAHGILQDQLLRALDLRAGTVPGRDSLVSSRRSKLVN